MPKKNITIDDLAAMVKRGFDETARQEDLDLLREDVGTLKEEVHYIKARIDNIEKILLFQHSEQLKSLETRVRRLELVYETTRSK